MNGSKVNIWEDSEREWGGDIQTYSEIFEAVPARTFDVRLNHV